MTTPSYEDQGDGTSARGRFHTAVGVTNEVPQSLYQYKMHFRPAKKRR